jgi:hypothetical protein
MPLVRELRRRTAASASVLPRKRSFETGGDRKYRSIWLTADFKNPDDSIGLFAYEFAKALNRPGIPQGFVTMSSGNKTSMASPLSWTAFAGLKDMKNPAFQPRLDALLLQDPNSAVSQIAIADYLKALKAEIAKISAMAAKGEPTCPPRPSDLPGFPDASSDKTVKPDTVPTFTYNWCVSPLTPMAVSGVVWIPDATNIGYTPPNTHPSWKSTPAASPPPTVRKASPSLRPTRRHPRPRHHPRQHPRRQIRGVQRMAQIPQGNRHHPRHRRKITTPGETSPWRLFARN